MRPRAWVVILFLCIVMFICRVQFSGGSAHAEPKKTPRAGTARPSAPAVTTVRESWDVYGVAPNSDDAKKIALDEARDKVVEYLAKLNPPMQWRPDAEYLQQNKMVTFSEPAEQEVGVEIGQKVSAKVEITSKTFADMQDQDRKYRADLRKLVSRDRQTLLGKILAGFVASLAAVAVYLRLDEATKGYYSLWLRLGSVALVATIGAGAWLLL
jgi:hypothetical protein